MIDYTRADLERFAGNDDILPKLLDAERAGDEATAAALRKRMIYPAESLLAARDAMGPEWIIKEGLNCSEAERKYGKDWLYNDRL
ncbi:MAG: hypothetical protein HQL35_09135 [Alphaproteobacteria bacterium]|nr:hypothetical protein [Alphaproteobacteria bacterium]